ncbi:hypothetical protein GCM10009601_39370 [Streptomyces thermospinosisporus]|uniref:Sigma-70 family RNA polymerase sigma factor n=1 Tax=Streptomyces thermospinosisporus TaxID=161482 RepID=A0ABN1Z1K3_9ACTN
MPPKKKVTLPEHVRAAVLADIELTHQTAIQAEENDKVRIFLATQQGLDTYEIADKLGISQSSVSKYARQGREILERRRREAEARESGGQPSGEDPFRPGEPEPVG